MKLSEDLRTRLIGFISSGMDLQIKLGKTYEEDDLGPEIYKSVSTLGAEIDDEDFAEIKKALEYRFKIKHTAASYIFNNYEDIPDWYTDFKPKEEFFWNRYRDHLLNHEKLNINSINKLESETLMNLMNCLGNPNDEFEGQRLRRGLVIGDVQSGKTATYGGLICKAADAGYKVVILLTGVTESLRKQTQERMEEGIIGFTVRVDNTGKKVKTFKKVGVGLDNQPPRGTAYTSYQDDFVGDSDNIIATLNAHKSLVMFVVKKNVAVLTKLYNWLLGQNQDVLDGLIHVPMLLIDDEADNASINTKKDKLDPTKTNKVIRQICNSFNNATYVGFTATPFANVFIDPDTTEEMENADLFPEHFIYVLPTPSNYIGAQKIFYEDGQWHSMLKYITDIEEPDDEDLKHIAPSVLNSGPLYYKHQKEWQGTFPDSMEESIYCYLIANAVRDLRGDAAQPRTMMINVSRFVKVQKYIKEYVESLYSAIHTSVNVDFSDDNAQNEGIEVYDKFVYVWNKHFKNLGISQEKVINKDTLFKAIDKIQVLVVNSDKSSMKLDYKANPSMRIIAVGGLALSRGLTLKGLMTSYFYRNTATFDVLMQMGRWFGYRYNYEDLCQVWTSHTSARWYEEITKSTEELKDDIRRMFDEKMTPKEFGLRVRDESNELQITAASKMRNSFHREEFFTFWGGLFETPYSSKNPANNIKNFESVKNLVDSLHKGGIDFENNKGTDEEAKTKVAYNVPIDYVFKLLSSIETSIYNQRFDPKTIMSFLKEEYCGKLAKWDIAIHSGSMTGHIDYGHGVLVHPAKRQMFISNGHISFTGRGTLGGPTDGYIGVEPGQILKAKKGFDDYKDAHHEPKPKSYPNHVWFRFIEDRNPLLVIYSVRPDMKKLQDDNDVEMLKYMDGIQNLPVIGFAIGFPANGAQATKSKKYKVNTTYMRQLLEQTGEEDEEL